MVSGLKLIYERLKDLLQRGGTLRFLTGDYLDVTEPGALRRLLDLTDPNRPGPELRIFHAADQSFHPKAYIFRQENGSATAIVGSSNLSATALGPGVEWSYRVITSRDQAGFARASDAFEQLFSHPATATRSSNRPSTPSGVSVPAPTQALDYLVMHEFHHAAANTYRRLLDHVDPPVSPLWDSSVSMSSMAASDDSTVQRR